METQAQELERLFRRAHPKNRPGDLFDFIAYQDFLEKFGETVETKPTKGPVDLDHGSGFQTTFTMKDGSVWTTSETYLTDDQKQIAFETRPKAVPA